MYCLHPRADESIKRVVSTPSWMEKPPCRGLFYIDFFFQGGNWDFEMQNKWQSTQTPLGHQNMFIRTPHFTEFCKMGSSVL